MTDHDNDESATPPPTPPPVPDSPSLAPPPAPPRVALGADGQIAVTPPAAPVPLWKRIPKKLLIGGPIVLIVVVIGWLAGRGTTDADDLKAGDCFESPTGNDIRDVKDQSCDGLHDVEILAVTSLPAGAAWPGLNAFALVDTPASDACFNAIDPNLIIIENVPADTLEGHFFPDRDGWEDGDHKILCYAESEQGFPGPVMIRE